MQVAVLARITLSVTAKSTRLAGNDRVYGNSGDDVLTGEARSDYLNGGDHDDTIYAQGTYL